MVGQSVRHGSVMIVDDEPDMLETLRDTLQEFLKIQVLTASTPQEALERLTENRVHLILSDYNMPGMNGYEFLQQAKKIYPNVQLMLMTGYEKMAEKDSHILPLQAAFKKPFNPKRLVQAIREQMPMAE